MDIARESFSEQGYGATSTEAIIKKAQVTKGALYHHFQSKKALFEAVYRELEDEVAEHIAKASSRGKDPWQQLLYGCFAYLEACAEPGFRRVMRADAPAVLGMEHWATIDREYGVERLLPFIKSLKRAGLLRVRFPEAFTWQLTGAMNEATFWIAQHPNPKKALRESKAVLKEMLESVRGHE